MKSIWIAAGGTGGHISPAVSLAYEFSNRGASVTLITLPKNTDYPDIKSLVFHPSINVVTYPAPLMPTRPKPFLYFLPRMLQCWFTLRQHNKMQQPEPIIGMGGYPSFPATLFAKWNKIPLFLCEQNSVHGKITRLMQKYAQKVFLSFPQKDYKENEVLTGNPIRAIFSNEPKNKQKTKTPVKRDNRPILFFIGGSQGAKDLNQLYLYMTQNEMLEEYKIIISTGKKDYEMMKQNARTGDEVYSFIENMPATLKASAFIIARAGSSTIFEGLWAKRPMVFLPYPFATDDHQKINALHIQDLKVAEIIDLRPFNAAKAAEQLLTILSDKKYSEKEINRQFKDLPFPEKAQSAIADLVLSAI